MIRVRLDKWQHAVLAVYLTICMFDFVAMPIWIEQSNRRLTPIELVRQTLLLNPDERISGMTVLSIDRRWQSLTMTGMGIFHISFAALLGVSVVARTPTTNTSPDESDER